MKFYDSAWTVAAIGVVLVAALIVLTLENMTEAAAIAGFGGVCAVLLAAYPSMKARDEERIAKTAAPIPAHNIAIDMLDSLHDPVLLVRNNRITIANHGAKQILGTHILGEDIRTAIRHPAAYEHINRLNRAVPDPGIELVGIGGRDQFWLMRVHDLSDEAKFVHLVDHSIARAAERMRGDFVANASHELRTPLAAILGFAETLSDDKAGGDPATRTRFLGVITKEAQRMQTLVDDLISLSRIEADKHRAPGDAVDLGTLIAEVTKSVHGNDRPLQIDIAPEISPVAGDKAQLSQLLHNIIGNAVKYGRPGTPIAICVVQTTPSMIRMSITDQGEGIAADHIPRLTERFYRVDSGRSRSMGGTGLGLSIVKHIVERHRGRLEISSIIGTGTTISVTLPIA